MLFVICWTLVIVALIFRPASSSQFNANSSSICIANVIVIVMFINPILIFNYIIFENHIDWEKYDIEIQKRNAQIHLAPSSLLPFLTFSITPLNLISNLSKFSF